MKRDSMRPLVALLAIMAYLVVACGGGTPNEGAYPGPVTVDGSGLPVATQVGGPTTAATLTCSQECADRGQCGQSPDRGRVVLLGAAAPAVSPLDFNLAIADGAAVSVLETRPVQVVENTSGFAFSVDFYRVLVLDRNVEGWVTAWCILNPVP